MSSSLSLSVRVVGRASTKVEVLSVFLREMKISFSCVLAEVAGLEVMGWKVLVGPS